MPHHTDADWMQYFQAVDAITGRNPKRMKQNGMDMLRMKVVQIEDEDLQVDAWAHYFELKGKVEEWERRA